MAAARLDRPVLTIPYQREPMCQFLLLVLFPRANYIPH
jgi:hypothetical protein